MVHDAHTGFIVAAYVIAIVVVGAMIGVILADHRALKRSLARFGPRDAERE